MDPQHAKRVEIPPKTEFRQTPVGEDPGVARVEEGFAELESAFVKGEEEPGVGTWIGLGVLGL